MPEFYNVHWVQLPSLETRWLSKGEALPQPNIGYCDSKDYGGLYLHPHKEESHNGGIIIPPSANGTIIISDFDDEFQLITLVHEWRHHWQYWNGINSDSLNWQDKEDYYDELFNYFKSSWTEYDALRFEVLKTNSELSKWTLEKVHTYKT